MSEPRFTIQKASGVYLHLPIFDNGVEMADGDVCILLNEQQATIEMYQRRVDKREEQISIIKKHCLKFLTDEQVETIRKELKDE